MKAKKRAVSTAKGAPHWVPITGALVAVAGLVWAIVSFFLKPESAAKPSALEQKAEAIGGIAINASAGARVLDGVDRRSGSENSLVSQPSHPVSQSARSRSGGTAVNATDSAEVKIENP